MIRAPALLLLLALLAACGGADDADPPAPPPEPVEPSEPDPPEPVEPVEPVEPEPPEPVEPPLDPQPPPPPPLTQQERWLAAVNAFRGEEQLCPGEGTVYAAAPPLRWDGALELAAIAHSADMAEHDFFSHTGSNGSHFSSRAFAAGYRGSPLGENIAAGSADFERILRLWINSTAGHCRHLMDPVARDVGIGTAFDAASTYSHYWTYVSGIGGGR